MIMLNINKANWYNHLISVVFLGQETESGLDDTTAKTEDQVKGRLFLDVIIWKSSSILKLLSGEDETLLIWRDSFLVLDLGFHILDRVGRLDLEGDGLAREGLNEDLHRELATKKETIYKV